MRRFSTKEVAALIARTPETVPLLFERIRHWTREGLLRPYGEENPGTGRRREYAETEVRKARLLNILADFGISIKTLKAVSDAFDKEFVQEFATAPDSALILTVKKRPSGTDQVSIKWIVDDLKDEIRVPIERNVDGILVVNLSRLIRT